MTGKGSTRRPSSIPDEAMADAWSRIFGTAEEKEKEVSSDFELILGDCLEKMKGIPDGSVDAVICDPPYGNMKGAGLDGWTEDKPEC